jgi:hypothetical protein
MATMNSAFTSWSIVTTPILMTRKKNLVVIAFLTVCAICLVDLAFLKPYISSGVGGGSTVRETEHQGNKTLVVLLGGLRCGELAWESLYQNVLDINSADLALILQEPREAFQNASILSRAKYIWQIPQYKQNDWSEAVDLVRNDTTWRERLMPLRHERSILLGGVQGVHGSALIIFWFRWFLAERIKELKWTERYDRFVISRNDHFYLCPHNLCELDPNYMWVPTGEDYGGICDRHLVVNATDALEALDMLPPLLDTPERYTDLLNESAANSETYVKRRWEEEHLLERVNRFDRNFFMCATTGDTNLFTPLWWGEETPVGVYSRYRGEYALSLQTCNSRLHHQI